MDFEYTEEQKQLKEEVAAFAKRESAALPKKYREESIFPFDLWRKVGEKKWCGVLIPEAYGGMGKGITEFTIITEELSKEGLPCLQPVIQTLIPILHFGTEDLKRRYLPKLANGEYVAASAISEPGAGSSFKNLQTTAKKDNGFYVVKGHKSHINNAGDADVINMLVKTDLGLSYLLLDKGMPGVRFRKDDAIGFRLMPIYQIFLEDCRIPEDHLIGKEGEGVKIFLAAFNVSRVGMASICIGLARGLLEHALTYAKSRKVDGEHYVTDFQAMQWMLADLVVEIESAKLLRDKAAWLFDHEGHAPVLEIPMAKFFACDMAIRVATKVFSLVGGVASYTGSIYERFLREIMASQAAGGSNEIMRNDIAREVLRAYKV